MRRWEILARLVAGGVVPVIRAESAQSATQLMDAVHAGGIDCLELTMTVPGAVDLLKEVAPRFLAKGCLVGAGTVLDAVTARLCLLAGAEFLVTPAVIPEVAAMAHLYQKPLIMGAQSVTEVTEALRAGADLVKLFPGSHLTPDFLKALRGPLPQAPCMPSGGVTKENISQWFKAGAVAVSVGGELTGPGAKGDYAAVTALSGEFYRIVQEARA